MPQSYVCVFKWFCAAVGCTLVWMCICMRMRRRTRVCACVFAGLWASFYGPTKIEQVFAIFRLTVPRILYCVSVQHTVLKSPNLAWCGGPLRSFYLVSQRLLLHKRLSVLSAVLLGVRVLSRIGVAEAQRFLVSGITVVSAAQATA